MVRVDDRLLFLIEEAELKVVAADPAAYKELASYDKVAPSVTWGHLALAGGRLYVKDKNHVTAFSFGGAPE